MPFLIRKSLSTSVSSTLRLESCWFAYLFMKVIFCLLLEIRHTFSRETIDVHCGQENCLFRLSSLSIQLEQNLWPQLFAVFTWKTWRERFAAENCLLPHTAQESELSSSNRLSGSFDIQIDYKKGSASVFRNVLRGKCKNSCLPISIIFQSSVISVITSLNSFLQLRLFSTHFNEEGIGRIAKSYHLRSLFHNSCRLNRDCY